MKIDSIIDMDKLKQHIADGYVSERKHATMSLTILNYTDRAQFDNVWDDVTMACRGIIYNHDTGELLARPFPKFFNWDQGQVRYPPAGPCLRMEKMDGSLGILYVPEWLSDGTPQMESVATRGSFHSEQAEWATDFYVNRLCEVMTQTGKWFVPKRDKTYLFEIIYPANRVVVDYGDYSGLVLLDVIDNETGFSDIDEFENCDWPDYKVGRTVMFKGFDSGQVVDINSGEEGFVYLWPTRNFRTKMKSAEYIELHKLVTGLNEKSVWKAMVNGKNAAAICNDLPDEFHQFVKDTYSAIETKMHDIVTTATAEFNEIVAGLQPEWDRKQFAVKAAKSRNSKYLFAALDNRSLFEIALHDCKPKIQSVLTRE